MAQKVTLLSENLLLSLSSLLVGFDLTLRSFWDEGTMEWAWKINGQCEKEEMFLCTLLMWKCTQVLSHRIKCDMLFNSCAAWRLFKGNFIWKERVSSHPFPPVFSGGKQPNYNLKGTSESVFPFEDGFWDRITRYCYRESFHSLRVKGRLIQGKLWGLYLHPFEQGSGGATGFLLPFVSDHQWTFTAVILTSVFPLEHLW